MSFSGFKSTIHGIASFEWAVGTKPGLEDVQPFTETGLIPPEEDYIDGSGNDICYLNFHALCCFRLARRGYFCKTFFFYFLIITKDQEIIKMLFIFFDKHTDYPVIWS